MAVMRFWLVHFQESSSWEPLNRFEWNLVWMFLWRSLTSFDSFWAIYEFQNDHLWRSKFYWNSMGNNIFIIFSRNTQQNTTKLGTFVNFMCVYKCPVQSQYKKPNPILAFYIQTRGAQTTIYREKTHSKLRAQWVRPNASEALSVWNCCNTPAVLIAGSAGLFNKPNSVRIWCNGR
jgi:hypothetical protein